MSRTDGQHEEEEEEDDSGFEDGVLHADKGPNPNEMASDYLPESDQWAAKTVLDEHDPGAIAALRHFDVMFPEVEELQPLIDGVIDEHLPARTSVQGNSRDEYREIIMSMFGGQGTVEESKAWVAALGADEDD
jgi:hypothetical protein